jgi:hypothetical protein
VDSEGTSKWPPSNIFTLSTSQCCVVQCSMVLCIAVQHSAVQHDTVKDDTAHYTAAGRCGAINTSVVCVRRSQTYLSLIVVAAGSHYSSSSSGSHRSCSSSGSHRGSSSSGSHRGSSTTAHRPRHHCSCPHPLPHSPSSPQAHSWHI